MFALTLHVALCFSNTDCVAYEPQVWTANSVAELNKDLEAYAKVDIDKASAQLMLDDSPYQTIDDILDDDLLNELFGE